MKKSIFNIAIISLTCICIISYTYFTVKLYKQNTRQKEQFDLITKVLDESLVTQYLNWQLPLDTLLNVDLAKQKQKTKLFNLLDKPKVLFFFSNKMCNPCIIKELANLKELYHTIGKENIILVGKISHSFFLNTDDWDFFKNDIWRCKTNLLKHEIEAEVPVMIYIKNQQIKIGYYAPKASNNCYFSFQKIMQNEFLQTNNTSEK